MCGVPALSALSRRGRDRREARKRTGVTESGNTWEKKKKRKKLRK